MPDHANTEGRGDLAAAFRWTARLDLHESVANHFSLAVDAGGGAGSAVPTARGQAALDIGHRAGGLDAEHERLLYWCVGNVKH